MHSSVSQWIQNEKTSSNSFLSLHISMGNLPPPIMLHSQYAQLLWRHLFNYHRLNIFLITKYTTNLIYKLKYIICHPLQLLHVRNCTIEEMIYIWIRNIFYGWVFKDKVSFCQWIDMKYIQVILLFWSSQLQNCCSKVDIIPQLEGQPAF